MAQSANTVSKSTFGAFRWSYLNIVTPQTCFVFGL